MIFVEFQGSRTPKTNKLTGGKYIYIYIHIHILVMPPKHMMLPVCDLGEWSGVSMWVRMLQFNPLLPIHFLCNFGGLFIAKLCTQSIILLIFN